MQRIILYAVDLLLFKLVTEHILRIIGSYELRL